MESVQRQIVIRQIYEKSEGRAYKDLRKLYSPRRMEKRLHMIDVLLSAAGMRDDEDRRRLETERLLLTKKYEIYTRSPNLPMVGAGPRKLLKLTDRHPEDDKESRSESARGKKAHTVVLLHFAYIDHSYEELVALLGSLS